MSLSTLWFILIAILWGGFFVLEGFDFGVGMLHGIVGRTEDERRTGINSIGPFWDGNEVWLIVAGAAIFAAFPSWYATMFSSLYLAMVLVLLALMGRGTTFEYRNKGLTPRWRRVWSWVLTLCSLLVPFVLGVGIGDLLAGLPINSSGAYTGNAVDILTPYGIWVGVTITVACLLNGALFLSLKTSGEVRDRSQGLVTRLIGPVILVAAILIVWTIAKYDHSSGAIAAQVIAVAAVLFVLVLFRAGRPGWAFAANIMAIAAVIASLFIDLYPNVMVSSTNSAYNLTVSGTASNTYALQVMTVIAVIFLPLVLGYQAWNYYVFRSRVASGRHERKPDKPAAV